MADRRRSRRFSVNETAIGSLRVVQDVDVHRLDEAHVTILSDRSVPRGERMWLQVQEESGSQLNLLVQAVEHRICVEPGRVRQKVRLQVVQAARADATG